MCASFTTSQFIKIVKSKDSIIYYYYNYTVNDGRMQFGNPVKQSQCAGKKLMNKL